MSRWTFSTVSFNDPGAPNFIEQAMQVEAVTEGEVGIDKPFDFKILCYPFDKGVDVDFPPGDDGYKILLSTVSLEFVSETITLTYGKGNTSFPDLAGNTNVYDPTYKYEYRAYKTVTYSRYYRNCQLAAPTEGKKEPIFHFLDESVIIISEFNVFDDTCREGFPDFCPTQFECEAENMYWYDGACHLDPECRDDNYPGCYNQADCEAVGGEWYNNQCNSEPECRADNLPGCYNQADCASVGGYWNGSECVAVYPQTLTIKRRFAQTILVGASVWIYSDEAKTNLLESGISDINGQYTTLAQTPGETYYVKFTHSDIINSDADNFENDSYVAEFPTV